MKRNLLLLSFLLILSLYQTNAYAIFELNPGDPPLSINNIRTIEHDTGVIINTAGGAGNISLIIEETGALRQITTQAQALVVDPPTPPPSNAAIFIASPVGNSNVTIDIRKVMNQSGEVSAASSTPSDPHGTFTSHYSPAMSLAGNCTVNNSGIIQGDILIRYTLNGANNVNINLLDGSQFNGNIINTDVIPEATHQQNANALGTVNLMQNNHQSIGYIKGLSQINIQQNGVANIGHAYEARNISIVSGTVNLNNGGSLKSTNPLINNATLRLTGGDLISGVNGNGNIHLITGNFSTRGNIQGQAISIAPGTTFTLNAGHALSSNQAFQLNGVSTLRINGGVLAQNVSDNGSGTIEVNNPFTINPGTNIQINTIRVNPEGVINTNNSAISGFSNFENLGKVTIAANTTAKQNGIIVNKGVFNINNGTTSAETISNLQDGVLSIKGGTINARIVNNDRGFLKIHDGTFNGQLNHLAGKFHLHRGTFNAPINIMGGEVKLINSHINANAGLINNSKITLEGTNHLQGNYTQNAGSTLSTTIANNHHFGSLHIQGNASINPESTLEIILPNNGNIHEGDNFEIVTASHGNVSDMKIALPANSPFIFLKANSGNQLKLTAKRRYYLVQAADSEHTRGVASALEEMRFANNDPKFNHILAQLDNSPSEKVGELLSSLAPNHTDGGVFRSGIVSMAGAIRRAEYRLDLGRLHSHESLETHELGRSHSESLDTNESNDEKRGYVSGDLLGGQGSWGPIFFVDNIMQKNKDGFTGFKSVTEGAGLLIDNDFNEGVQLGFGAVYAGTTVRTKNDNGKTIINSLEGLVYGGVYQGPTFIDGSFVLSQNWYNMRRELVLGDAQPVGSKHRGVQYSAKVRGGLNIPAHCMVITPLATVQYVHLHQNSFLENGYISRFTGSQNTHLAQGGVGVKLSSLHDPRYISEVHVLYLRDLNNPKLQVTSFFTGGGPSFTIAGPNNIHKNSINLGAGLSAQIAKDVFFSGTYDFEGKKRYRNHAGTLKLRWVF